ncbi:Uncharacterised protein [Mycobacteroides abscessus subsp. abscessus]|nr:Uncharacterised protein [Mycobacteroides abscessus subsp. abscessus]
MRIMGAHFIFALLQKKLPDFHCRAFPYVVNISFVGQPEQGDCISVCAFHQAIDVLYHIVGHGCID